jgi:LmbE family N-acetylglucosaminyl deacetylase
VRLKNTGAEIFVPDDRPLPEAMSRTTHMAIAAHQDDIEILAYDGIARCFGKEDSWFMGVVVTNGSGSPRNGPYAEFSDERMREIRKLEQKKAAVIGEYSAVALLDYSSDEVKDPRDSDIVNEIADLVMAARPSVLYTHNFADKHDTHVAVAVKVIQALRSLPPDALPEKIYGCEVWRDLDWLPDNEKVSFDVSTHPNIAAALLEVFDSQICGGKRYDLATAGRRLANATFSASHGTDETAAVSYAMDLTPLILNKGVDICEYITAYIDRFKEDVAGRIKRYV